MVALSLVFCRRPPRLILVVVVVVVVVVVWARSLAPGFCFVFGWARRRRRPSSSSVVVVVCCWGVARFFFFFSRGGGVPCHSLSPLLSAPPPTWVQALFPPSERPDLLLWCVRGGAYNRLCLGTRGSGGVGGGGGGGGVGSVGGGGGGAGGGGGGGVTAAIIMTDASALATVLTPSVLEVQSCLQEVGRARAVAAATADPVQVGA